MISWKIKDNIISEISLQNEPNIIEPWGVETADSWSFFSLEKNVGYRYHTTSEQVEALTTSLKQSKEIEFSSGRFKLISEDLIVDNKICRTSELIAESDLDLMDFVQRYRFKKEFFSCALINGQKIVHRNTNVYYQFPVKEVELHGNYRIKIKILEQETAGKFQPTMYVRDRGEEWIVHIRMMPVQYASVVIKLCSSLFKTSPLPSWLTHIILSVPGVYNRLLYRGERTPYRSKIARLFSPNAFPMARLKKGERLYWKSVMEWHER